jgi:hypothetical protein
MALPLATQGVDLAVDQGHDVIAVKTMGTSGRCSLTALV